MASRAADDSETPVNDLCAWRSRDLSDVADEFVRVAGLDLDAGQAAELREALRLHPESGAWQMPTWTVRDPKRSLDLVAARVLLGFLVLGENVIWSAPYRLGLTDPFRLLVRSVSRMGTPADGLSRFDLGDGVTVKVRYANGEEQLERLDTGTRVRFLGRYNTGRGRGMNADLLVVDDTHAYTTTQQYNLAPTMATSRNPQIVYA
jgi:hypothetical protein